MATVEDKLFVSNICKTLNDLDLVGSKEIEKKLMGAEVYQLQSCPVERLFLVGGFLDSLVGKYNKELDLPGNIVQESQKNKVHNEVNVMGSNGGGVRTKPVGIFVKIAPNGNLFQYFWDVCETLGPDILQCSYSQKIPIVPIVDDSDNLASVSDVGFKEWLLGDASWGKFE